MTPTDPNAAAGAVIDLVTGAWRTQATCVAARLRLPDLVAAGHDDDASLARETGLDDAVMRRLLRVLVLLGLLSAERDGTGTRRYRTTPVGDLLRDRPGSLRSVALLYGEEFYAAWGRAGQALTGDAQAFEAAHGTPLLAYLADHEEVADRFQQAMEALHFALDDVPRVFDFSGHRRVCDVGGGRGQLLAAVLAAAPHLKGVLLDLPHNMPLARAHLAATVGLDRVELVGRDMFDGPLPRADVHLLSRVLGGWDDEACVRLLRGLRATMDAASRLLVIARVPTDDGRGPLAALWDLQLLVLIGGRERTLEDYHRLFGRSGLAVERVEELALETKALVVAPAG
jgi:hypothetical protein